MDDIFGLQDWDGDGQLTNYDRGIETINIMDMLKAQQEKEQQQKQKNTKRR